MPTKAASPGGQKLTASSKLMTARRKSRKVLKLCKIKAQISFI